MVYYKLGRPTAITIIRELRSTCMSSEKDDIEQFESDQVVSTMKHFKKSLEE